MMSRLEVTLPLIRHDARQKPTADLKWYDTYVFNKVLEHDSVVYVSIVSTMRLLKGPTIPKEYFVVKFKRYKHKGNYKVKLDWYGNMSCSCPKNKFRGEVCGHMLKVIRRYGIDQDLLTTDHRTHPFSGRGRGKTKKVRRLVMT